MPPPPASSASVWHRGGHVLEHRLNKMAVPKPPLTLVVPMETFCSHVSQQHNRETTSRKQQPGDPHGPHQATAHGSNTTTPTMTQKTTTTTKENNNCKFSSHVSFKAYVSIFTIIIRF